jgi:hypothetical protein
MIHRYVIVLKDKGKIFLSPTRAEFDDEAGYKILEVLLPLEDFCSARDLITELEVLNRSGHESFRVPELQKEILRNLAKFAKNDKDRSWLFEAGKE